jgi:hypothetical protein
MHRLLRVPQCGVPARATQLGIPGLSAVLMISRIALEHAIIHSATYTSSAFYSHSVSLPNSNCLSHRAPALWSLLQAVHGDLLLFAFVHVPVALTCPYWLPETHSA